MAETIKTLKPSGGDYTSISAWVSGEAKALGVDAVDVLECYKGDYTAVGGGTNYIVDDSTISGWSNITTTAYASIRTPTAERHNGKAYDAVGDYTGFTVKKSSIAEHSSCILDNQQRTHTLGLIFALDKTSGYGDLRGLSTGAGGGYGVHGKHIAVSESLATSGGNYLSGIAFGVIAQYYTDRTVSLYDSVVIGKGNGASGKWHVGVACDGSHVYNCTVLHTDICYSAGKPSNEYAAVYNCIAESNAGGTCYSGAGVAGDYNLANDATAPGINSVQSTTLTYTDAANGNYSLASSDTAAIGAGADDPGAGLYSDDILSVAFVSPWDMGAFKFSATGGTTVTGSGALAATLATLSGGGIRAVVGSGALVASTASTTGAGTVSGAIVGAGSLQAEIATAAGTGTIIKVGSGALVAEPATVVGVGAIGGTISGSGTLQALDASLGGTGTITKTGTGNLVAVDAIVSGFGARKITGSGTLAAAPTSLVGFGVRNIVGWGTLDAEPAVVGGIGLRSIFGFGSLQADTAKTNGLGNIITTVVGSGSLVATAARVRGRGQPPASAADNSFLRPVYRPCFQTIYRNCVNRPGIC